MCIEYNLGDNLEDNLEDNLANPDDECARAGGRQLQLQALDGARYGAESLSHGAHRGEGGEGERRGGERRGGERRGDSHPASWADAIYRRLDCWWIGLSLPARERLGSCLGALGLHLVSRLGIDQMARSSGGDKAAEAGCEWLDEAAASLRLPTLPADVDGAFRLELLPPIPRLLPGWWQQRSLGAVSSAEVGGGLLLRGDSSAVSQADLESRHPSERVEREQRLVTVGGGAGALAAGALLALLVSCRSSSSSRRFSVRR